VAVAHALCPERGEAERTRRTTELLRGAGIPEGTERMTLDNFRPTPGTRTAYEAARAFAANPGPRGIVFAGPMELGKTHLSLGIARRLVERGVGSICRTVPEVMDLLRAALDRGDQDSVWGTMEVLRLTPVLILDDLGAERSTEWTRERLFVVVNGRELGGTPIVGSTNHPTPDALAAAIGGLQGERIASRLNRSSDWIQLSGPPYRTLFGEGGQGR
jgi:DNA replication protein DnaC